MISAILKASNEKIGFKLDNNLIYELVDLNDLFLKHKHVISDIHFNYAQIGSDTIFPSSATIRYMENSNSANFSSVVEIFPNGYIVFNKEKQKFEALSYNVLEAIELRGEIFEYESVDFLEVGCSNNQSHVQTFERVYKFFADLNTQLQTFNIHDDGSFSVEANGIQTDSFGLNDILIASDNFLDGVCVVSKEHLKQEGFEAKYDW